MLCPIHFFVRLQFLGYVPVTRPTLAYANTLQTTPLGINFIYLGNKEISEFLRHAVYSVLFCTNCHLFHIFIFFLFK
jgi:hypothetical protein